MEIRGRVSEKQALIKTLDQTYLIASSESDFYQKLQDKGLILYSYRGKVHGIRGKRKFRFRTLGFDKSMLKKLEKEYSQTYRLRALKQIRIKQKGRSKGREY